MICKALSLTQPWATLVALSEKKIETRSWRTSYRGPLVIHAAKTIPRYARELMTLDPNISMTLVANGYTLSTIPRGVVLGVGMLTDCVPTEHISTRLDARELSFGDFARGRWAWCLSNVVMLEQPVEATGALQLWDMNAVEGTELDSVIKYLKGD